jgi:hypothetical protein
LAFCEDLFGLKGILGEEAAGLAAGCSCGCEKVFVFSGEEDLGRRNKIKNIK